MLKQYNTINVKKKKNWESISKNKIGISTNRFKDLKELDDTYSEGEIEKKNIKLLFLSLL